LRLKRQFPAQRVSVKISFPIYRGGVGAESSNVYTLCRRDYFTGVRKRKGEKEQHTDPKTTMVTAKMSDVNLATIQLDGEKQNFILGKKDFKTGSRGYHAQGKMFAGGKNYQINILCVEIGSKPKEKEK